MLSQTVPSAHSVLRHEELAGHGRVLPLASTNVPAASGKGRRTRAAIILLASDIPGRNEGAGTSSGSGKPCRAAR